MHSPTFYHDTQWWICKGHGAWISFPCLVLPEWERVDLLLTGDFASHCLQEGFSDSDEDEPHSIRSTGVVELNMLSPLDLAAEDRKSSGSCTNSASGGSDSGNIGAVEEDSCDAGFQWENSK